MKRVLIVDDERDITFMIKQVLDNNYQTDTANEPLKALAGFDTGKYELLILDISMPKMNGLDFYREVMRRDKNIKVILITAMELQSYEFYANFRREFPDFQDFQIMRKPFGSADIKDRIEKLVSLR